jgi:hypothetical protein
MAGYRGEFGRALEAIEAKVIELFAVIAEDLPRATAALLNGDDADHHQIGHATGTAYAAGRCGWPGGSRSSQLILPDTARRCGRRWRPITLRVSSARWPPTRYRRWLRSVTSGSRSPATTAAAVSPTGWLSSYILAGTVGMGITECAFSPAEARS